MDSHGRAALVALSCVECCGEDEWGVRLLVGLVEGHGIGGEGVSE